MIKRAFSSTLSSLNVQKTLLSTKLPSSSWSLTTRCWSLPRILFWGFVQRTSPPRVWQLLWRRSIIITVILFKIFIYFSYSSDPHQRLFKSFPLISGEIEAAAVGRQTWLSDEIFGVCGGETHLKTTLHKDLYLVAKLSGMKSNKYNLLQNKYFSKCLTLSLAEWCPTKYSFL